MPQAFALSVADWGKRSFILRREWFSGVACCSPRLLGGLNVLALTCEVAPSLVPTTVIDEGYAGRGTTPRVQRFTVVDKSDSSPSPLTVHSDPPYSKEALSVFYFKRRGSLCPFMCMCSCSWSAFSSFWRYWGVFAGSIFGLPPHKEEPSAAGSPVC